MLWWGGRIFGQAPPEPLRQAARLQLRELRPYCFLVWLGIALAFGIQVVCLVYAWKLVYAACPKECDPLHKWLLGYACSLSLLPLSWAIAVPLVVWWDVDGYSVRSSTSSTCQQSVPALWFFVDKVTWSCIASSALVLLAFLVMLVIRIKWRRFAHTWSATGPAMDEVLREMLAAARADPPPDTECSICYGTPDHARWSSLPCRHLFHEECVLQWLMTSRRDCPLCRQVLPEEYLQAVEDDP